MQTHCVGRYQIDLPDDFEQHPASYAELFYGLDKDFRKVTVEIVRSGEKLPSFAALVNKRAAELAADDHFSSPSKSMLALKREVDDNTVLIRSYDSPRGLDSFVSEYISQVGQPIARLWSRVYSEGEPAEVVETRLLTVVKRMRPVSSVDTAGRGACLGGILLDAGQDGEVLSLTFRSGKLPDVVIQIDINSMLAKSDGGLLRRWDQNSGLLNKLDFHSSTLRRGKVQIGAMAGEELLSTGKDKGRTVRGFSAETIRLKPSTVAAPTFAISMNMGGQVAGGDYRDASFSEKDSLTLWDVIIKSIRLRPGAV